MIDFNGKSVKPLEIWGTVPWLGRLQRIGLARREQMALMGRPAKRVKLVDQKGRWVNGNNNLHGSQVYPATLCAIIAELHRRTLLERGIPQV